MEKSNFNAVVTIANRLGKPWYTSLFIEYAILSYRGEKTNVKQENKYLIERLDTLKFIKTLLNALFISYIFEINFLGDKISLLFITNIILILLDDKQKTQVSIIVLDKGKD